MIGLGVLSIPSLRSSASWRHYRELCFENMIDVHWSCLIQANMLPVTLFYRLVPVAPCIWIPRLSEEWQRWGVNTPHISEIRPHSANTASESCPVGSGIQIGGILLTTVQFRNVPIAPCIWIPCLGEEWQRWGFNTPHISEIRPHSANTASESCPVGSGIQIGGILLTTLQFRNVPIAPCIWIPRLGEEWQRWGLTTPFISLPMI